MFTSLIQIKEMSSKNIFHRIKFWFIFGKLKKMLNVIMDHPTTYGLLLNFCCMVSSIPTNLNSGVKAQILYNSIGSEVLGYEIIFKSTYGSVYVVLKDEDEIIEIKYPISENTNLNLTYRKEISSKDGRDQYADMISNEISLKIYNYLISYMKGEFDNVDSD